MAKTARMAGKGKKRRASSSRPAGTVKRVEVSGPIDRRAAEALRLAIRQLAQRHNVTIGEIRVERRGSRARATRP